MKKINITKKQDRVITFILLLIIVVLVNAIVIEFSASFDLTRDKIYSLSDASKLTLKNLKEPMSVKFFITPNLPPPFSTYEQYIKDLLSGYKSASRGNFNYEIIDASKSSVEATEYGIAPSQISVLEKDQTQTKRAYFGLTILYGDTVETIPFISSTEGLEYRISTLIKKMIDKNDRLARLTNNLDVYFIASSEIMSMLPPNTFDTLPISVNEAVIEANKKLMNKVVFHNVDVKSKEGEEILKKLDVKKLYWDEVKDKNGNIVMPKGDAYFSIILANGETTKELSIYSLIQGTKKDIVDEIQFAIDNLLKLDATIGYLQGNGEPSYMVIPPEYGGNPNDAIDSVADFVSVIADTYTFEPIHIKETPIGDNIDALLVVGSSEPLSDYELYQIDQFIMKGKPVLFMLNGAKIKEDQFTQMGMALPSIAPVDNKINTILENYGAIFDTNFIFDKESYKTSVKQGEPAKNIYYIPVILPENIDAKNTITKSINLLFTPLLSEVSKVTNNDNIKSKFTPLFYTSKSSWSVNEGDSFIEDIYPPSDTNSLKRFVAAGILEGEMRSAFDGRDIPKPSYRENTNSTLADLTTETINSTTRGKIILVGSYEMAKNNAFNINGIFLLNLIDYMAGDTGLMEIRRKGSVYNPPYSIGDTGKMIVRVVNITLLPVAIIVFGIILWNIDKKRREKIKKRFEK